jgi:hypothetical protein
MRKLLPLLLAVSGLSIGSGALLAQVDTSENIRPPPNSATQSVLPEANDDDATSTGVGSRALGEYKTEVDPGEAKGSDGELDIRRLDKQGRGGQEN